MSASFHTKKVIICNFKAVGTGWQLIKSKTLISTVEKSFIFKTPLFIFLLFTCKKYKLTNFLTRFDQIVHFLCN